MNTKQPILVIIGLGKDQKPRAATFTADEADAAAKVADLMGLKIARAETPEALALVKTLPAGRIYATGKGLLPLVRGELHEKLIKAVTFIEHKPIAHEHKAPPPPDPTIIDPWNLITTGTIVLYSTDPLEGWFHCRVVGLSADGKKLVLKWRDWPKLPEFEAKRIAVGVLCKIQ